MAVAPLPEVVFVAGSAEDVIIPLRDANGAAIPDLSGWTARCQVRHGPTASAPLLAEWSTGGANGITLGSSAARLVVSAALATASVSWTWRLGWWDLLLIAPTGQNNLPNRPIRGIMRVTPGITIG